MKRLVTCLVLLACAAHGQKTYTKGQVVKWQRQACGEFILPQKPIGGIEQPNITSTEYCNVYNIRAADRLFHITTSHRVSLTNGQEIQYRIEKKKMFIVSEDGKESKFKIIGEEIPPDIQQR